MGPERPYSVIQLVWSDQLLWEQTQWNHLSYINSHNNWLDQIWSYGWVWYWIVASSGPSDGINKTWCCSVSPYSTVTVSVFRLNALGAGCSYWYFFFSVLSCPEIGSLCCWQPVPFLNLLLWPICMQRAGMVNQFLRSPSSPELPAPRISTFLLSYIFSPSVPWPRVSFVHIPSLSFGHPSSTM